MILIELIDRRWRNRGIADSLAGFVFDTTASNTGIRAGCAKVLEETILRAVLWLAFRHHCYELHVEWVSMLKRLKQFSFVKVKGIGANGKTIRPFIAISTDRRTAQVRGRVKDGSPFNLNDQLISDRFRVVPWSRRRQNIARLIFCPAEFD